MTLADTRIDELLSRARNGDDAAANTLIAGVRDRVLRWAVVITGNMDDAEDVTQQVSITLHKHLGDFQAKSRFTTWLYRVVHNAAVDAKRNVSSRQHESLDAENVHQSVSGIEDQLDRLGTNRTAALVRSFFAELAPRQRELIELVDQQGYSAAEAADVMGIEPDTARVHLMRARRTLRAKMMERHPETFE